MKWVLTPLLLVTVPVSFFAGPIQTKSPQHKSTADPTKKAVPAKSVSSSHKSARATHSRSRRTRRAAAPAYQVHPDSSRYAEIQKALADRGYFKGEVNGQWNDDSVDALKRFQSDQKLDSDGKINSLTLIGLGLGPKHDVSVVPPHTTSPSSAAAVGTAPVTPSAPSAQGSTPPPSTPPN